MSTCRDCIHYEVCLENAKEELKSAGLNIDLENMSLPLNRCEDFKDKSKIVELPCEVGDEFYIITPSKRIKKKVVDSMTVGDTGIYAINSNSNFYFVSDFGKTVFTSKEAAEKALENKEENGNNIKG